VCVCVCELPLFCDVWLTGVIVGWQQFTWTRPGMTVPAVTCINLSSSSIQLCCAVVLSAVISLSHWGIIRSLLSSLPLLLCHCTCSLLVTISSAGDSTIVHHSVCCFFTLPLRSWFHYHVYELFLVLMYASHTHRMCTGTIAFLLAVLTNIHTYGGSLSVLLHMEAAESWERYLHNCSNQTVCSANESINYSTSCPTTS